MNHEETQMYLLSFLMLLVYRAGGKLEIEHLSEVAGKALMMSMDLKADKDKVILKVDEQKIDVSLQSIDKRYSLDGGSSNKSDYKTNPFGNQVVLIQSRTPRDVMVQLLQTALDGIKNLPEDSILTNNRLRTEEVTEFLDLMLGFNPDADARTIARNQIHRMLLEVGSNKAEL
jgi:hypothetical protein